MLRSILHCDMNNFYASVECMLDPALKKYPIAVCGSVEERHGIVLAKNYKAKAFDVKTGDAVWQAKQKCKDLVVVPPHYEEYIKYSKLARSVYERYTDQVEPYGMDECWLDISGTESLFGSPEKAMGQLLFLGVDVFEIKGVITGVMLGDWSEAGFIPVTTLIDRNWGDGGITRLFVRATGWEDVAHLTEVIPEVVRANQSAPYMRVRTQQDQLSRLQVTFMWVQVLLWLGIAASLMLGGFGIWYGTFAAVRARTREVGLKKAMGGSDGDILAQFLCEALCKSVAGGLIGIVLGVASVLVGVHMLGTPLPVLQLVLSCIGSILFSALIGIAGGIFPAVQASRMDVVTALRFE